MAKTIKAIVCPKCGSNKKIELKNDHYICGSCKTEYFLDNDDITIVHKNNDSLPIKVKSRKITLVLGAISVFVFFMLISRLLFSPSTTSANTSFNTDEKVDFRDQRMFLCLNKKQELLFVTVGIERSGNYEDRIQKIVVYFDDVKGKNLKKQEINFSVPKNTATSPFREKYFSNGEYFAIFNDKTLFKIDPDLLEMRELKQEYFHAPEFANGIAKLEEEYEDDGFKIQTLDGKSFTYMPIIEKVIPADLYRKEARKIAPNAVNTTQFTFVGDHHSPDFLLKYILQIGIGYPNDQAFFDIREGEMKSRHNPANLVSYNRFLPERAFFNADVIGLNDDLLIIKFTLDANRQSSNQIQALDPKTGAIKWTFDCSVLDDRFNFNPSKALSNKDFTLVNEHYNGIVLDNTTGKLVTRLEKK